MIRILFIVGSMNVGGAETFIMKMYRVIDKKKFCFDFCVASQGYYDSEIKQLGGIIYQISSKKKSLFKNALSIKKIVSNNHYKNVMRISQHSLSSLDLLAAKRGGASNCIFRSSNTNTGSNLIVTILHFMFRFLANVVPDTRIAPSYEAGVFMFGKKAMKNNKVMILYNGINPDVFFFDIEKRNNTRKKLQIDSSFVVGHIGRFSKQKNHIFLLQVFQELLKIKPNAKLLLVGKGENEEQVRNMVKDLKLKDKVLFLGLRHDIPELLMSMDLFIFPSLFEGLPNCVIEAQATGLNSIISDTISKDTNISPYVKYLSLKDSPKEWAIAGCSMPTGDRRKAIQNFKKTKFDINQTVTDFCSLLRIEPDND